MNITLIKALIGLGTAGAIGGGGYGIYVASRPRETVFDFLSKQSEITVLKAEGTENDSEWDEKVKELEGANPTPTLKNYVKSTNSEENKRKEEDRANLKNICKQLFKEGSSDEGKLAQVKKWCTKKNSA